jgi:hypothetical protein
MNGKTIRGTAILVAALALGACTGAPFSAEPVEPTAAAAQVEPAAAAGGAAALPPGSVDGSYDELELMRGRSRVLAGSVDGSYDPIELLRHRRAASGD